MKLTAYFNYLIISLALFSVPACSDDDNYAPGQEVSVNCEQVYFSKDNATLLTLPGDGPRTVSLTVAREKTTSFLSVPIDIIEKDEKLTIPSTIEFVAGSPTAELEITLPADAEAGTEYTFQLELTGEHVDTYTQLNGSTHFWGSVMIEKWNTLQATFTFGGLYTPLEEEILNLEGSNRYQIKNYLNSGKTLEFTIDKATGAITPTGGYNDGTYWQFKEGDSFVSCYPPGSDIYIESVYIYLGASYSYLKMKDKKGRLYHWNNYSDGSSNWNAIDISWK